MKLPGLSGIPKAAGPLGTVLLIVIGFFTREHWGQPLQQWVRSTIESQRDTSLPAGHEHGDADHAGHDHAEAATPNRLDLSDQARASMGLTGEFLQLVRLQNYRRSIQVPGVIVERPGRTRVEISTPMAGVITHVHAVQGEAVPPGTMLFQIRITGEELVSTQTELLKTVGELDVENREIIRLSKVTQGAVPPKALLEHQYAVERLEVLLATQREALRLHGLSERQIDEIAKDRRLLRDLQILAPSRDSHAEDELQLTRGDLTPIVYQAEKTAHDHADDHADAPHSSQPLILQDVQVHKGESVPAGTTLAVLTDLSELYIEGRAFEQDLDLLTEAARQNWTLTAVFEGAGSKPQLVDHLAMVYSSSTIDLESRTLRFYVLLPNEIVREAPSQNGQKFIDWKYRPGRRLQLRVPVEEWPDQIVVPVDAIAREGAESYVFQQNGNHFVRKAVQVKYRDSLNAVIANDGSIFIGGIIATRGAHQMQIALKNKSGGGVDPHAGHNH